MTDANAPPMGMRLRLKADFDISSFSAQNQVILTALKKYGMILADNGSAIFISGAPDPRWNNDDLSALKSITASNFEVVLMDPVYTDSNLPNGAAPSINNFTAAPHSVAARKPVKLSWSTGDAIYKLISPLVGPVRGTSIIIHPSATHTYTLYSTNQYGRATAQVTVKIR